MDKKNFVVFDELLDGVQVIDADFSYSYLNNAVRGQLSLEADTVEGVDFRTLCQHRGWDELLALAETCSKERTTGRKLLSLILSDGSRQRLVFRFQPIFLGLLITSATAEETPTSDWQDDKFRMLFEKMKETFIVFKAVREPDGAITDLQITELNTAAANFFGRPASELVGSLRSVVIGPLDEKSLMLYDRVINHGENFQLEQSIPDIEAHFKMSLFRPGPDHLAVVSTEVTELKKGERELKKLNERLEHIVAERTEALQEALDREMAGNALKNTFLSMTSHELNTPLASIQLSLDVLDKYNTGKHHAERERYHEHIRNEAQNLQRMVTRIRLESPINNVDEFSGKQKVDVKALTTEITHELSLLARGQQKILVTHEGENSVLVDGGILRRILINLLSNALKYSKEDVMLRSSVDEGRLNLMVRDQGIGIPVLEQEQVFSKNFRAGNTSSIIGTGLGLSIVHSYVQLLKGDIEFESKEDVGTTFWVSVPVEVVL